MFRVWYSGVGLTKLDGGWREGGAGCGDIRKRASDAYQNHVYVLPADPSFEFTRYSLALESFFLTLMFSRLNQVIRHLSRPLPSFAHSSAASITSSIMAGTSPQQKGLIHTAACLIIGDEVLGGKVCL
jgi:hypothetical protein